MVSRIAGLGLCALALINQPYVPPCCRPGPSPGIWYGKSVPTAEQSELSRELQEFTLEELSSRLGLELPEEYAGGQTAFTIIHPLVEGSPRYTLIQGRPHIVVSEEDAQEAYLSAKR